jgi:hypothetical protein
MDLSSLLTALLGLFQKGRQHNDDRNLQLETKRQEALQAMSEALITTHRYQDAQPDGVEPDRCSELAQLWNTAAIKSRVYLDKKGPYFEQRWMLEKGHYWLHKIECSHEEAVRRGIDLGTVERRIRTLIEQGDDM